MSYYAILLKSIETFKLVVFTLEEIKIWHLKFLWYKGSLELAKYLSWRFGFYQSRYAYKVEVFTLRKQTILCFYSVLRTLKKKSFTLSINPWSVKIKYCLPKGSIVVGFSGCPFVKLRFMHFELFVFPSAVLILRLNTLKPSHCILQNRTTVGRATIINLCLIFVLIQLNWLIAVICAQHEV